MLTIPKRLRVHTWFDRGLLGKLSSCAWTCLKAEAARLLGRDGVVPGMIGAIQTHGQLLHWHPPLHVLINCGAWTPQGAHLIRYYGWYSNKSLENLIIFPDTLNTPQGNQISCQYQLELLLVSW